MELGEKGDVRTQVLPLQPLRQVRVIRGELQEVLEQACGDYVSAVLTAGWIWIFLICRTGSVMRFPGCWKFTGRYCVRQITAAGLQPRRRSWIPLNCGCSFLKDADEGEKEVLRDVINTVLQEVNQG